MTFAFYEHGRQQRICGMLTGKDREKGAAGWAFLTWLLGGSLGLAVLVFVVLKVLGG
jgi:hypothetical protein